MEKDRLKLIVRNLELLVDSLKAEVYSDVDAYKTSVDNSDSLVLLIMMRFSRMTMTDTKKAKELVKLLEKLIKQDHLYSEEKIIEMKSQLREIKQQVAEYEKENSKGFGK